MNPFVPALAATFAASFGFMLPVSTPQNAIVYGSGVVKITSVPMPSPGMTAMVWPVMRPARAR
ncbi:hypothetical protein C6A85_10395 [Mycobacterium sp. ITM-2017-0098]|nr:hypothetical protein C6A85_10395 [Mycobacterium sp. ITM-2017-0098]